MEVSFGKRILLTVIPLLLCLSFIAAAFGQITQTPEFDPHRIIIKLKPTSRLLTRNVADARMARVKQLRPLKGDVGARTRPLPGGVERIFVTEIADGENLEDVLRELAANPDVEYAERDYIMHADDAGAPTPRPMYRSPLQPNDPFFNLQWGLQNTGQDYGGPGGVPGVDVNGAPAWDITTGDSNVILAILDTGILVNSPEFEGRIVPGYDFVNEDNVPADDYGHGTKIAGIAAASGGNGILIAGMDWKCRILPVKVLNSSGTGLNSVIARGIVWAADHGAQVINLSLGGRDGNTYLADAVSYAQSHGVIVVASMGNLNSEIPNYPAGYPGVIATGAINNRGLRAAPFSCSGTGGSNYGSHISFVAPGDRIISLDYNDPWQLALSPGCGTSDSVPFVSGLISLMFSVNPLLSYEQVYDALKAGARDQIGSPLEDTPGWDKYYGWGLIDAYKTLQSLPATSHTYFAQAAVGGGYTTTFTLLNTGSQAIAGNLVLTGNEGTPLSVAFSSPGHLGNTASSFPIQVASGGTQLITASAVDPSVLSTGWARVESSDSPLSGVATFQLEQAGVLTTIAGVLSAAETSSATIPIDDDRTRGPQSYTTGYAVANPGPQDIYVRVVVLNPDGSILRTLDPALLNPLKPGWHVARFLWEDLNDPQFQFKGSMVLTERAGNKFSVVALVLNQGLYTAVPVIAGSEAGAAGATGNMFAQMAVGGGFTTAFTIVNTGSDTASGNLILTSDNGTPLNALIASPGQPDVVAPSAPITVSPKGTQIITASAANPATTTAGWARVVSSGGSLSGVATFQLVSNGTMATIAGVLSTEATQAATIPVNDDRTLGVRSYITGYAVANPGGEDINIRITVFRPDGSVLQTIDPQLLNPLKPGWHVARFLWEDMNDPNLQLKGSMVLTERSGKSFSVVALVLNQGLYTAIPVIPEKAPGK
jgi:thermitase